MKNYLLPAIMTLFITKVSAQSKLEPFAEIQTVIPTQEKADPAVGIQFGTLYEITDFFSVGGGIGVLDDAKFKAAPTFPVFGRVEFNINKIGAVSPYVNTDFGYTINEYGGFFVNPTIGVKCNNWSIGVGYQGSIADVRNAEWSNAFNIKVGYGFANSKPITDFLSRTTLGVEYYYDINADSPDYNFWGTALNLKEFTSWAVSINWLYNISDSWAAGIGVKYRTCDISYGNFKDVCLEQSFLGGYLRGEYCFRTKSIQPYFSLDLGFKRELSNLEVSPQIGVKLFKHVKVGVAYNYVKDRCITDGHSNGTTLPQTLSIIAGINL